MSDSAVRLEQESGLALLTLAQPANRNALSFELLAELNDVLARVSADPSIRVAVLCAEGPAFSAGMNLKSVALDDPAVVERFARLLAETYRRLLLLPVPLLCGVDGPVMGGGVGVALAADLVYCGPSARFSLPETRIGLVPALVSIVVRRRVSPMAMSGLAVSGRELLPSDALRLGLVDHVSSGSGIDEARALARRIVVENSGDAMRRTKAFLQKDSASRLDAELESAIAEFRAAAAADSCRTGLEAFRMKKPLTWSD